MRAITAIALFAISLFASAASLPYEASFNQHGFSTTQTATMTGTDAAVFWFITPAEGRYLIQIAAASDSANVQHLATITDENNAQVAMQQGYYPSFYITIGRDLAPFTPYLMYVNNAKRDGSPSCHNNYLCNVTILIQPAN